MVPHARGVSLAKSTQLLPLQQPLGHIAALQMLPQAPLVQLAPPAQAAQAAPPLPQTELVWAA